MASRPPSSRSPKHIGQSGDLLASAYKKVADAYDPPSILCCLTSTMEALPCIGRGKLCFHEGRANSNKMQCLKKSLRCAASGSAEPYVSRYGKMGSRQAVMSD